MKDNETTFYRHSNHPALYYEDMLADNGRMVAYRRAIEASVRPGDVVADLGTGLAVLAMMAVQAGAERVYAVDNRPASIDLARRVIAANGMDQRIKLVQEDARVAQLLEPVDLIINELIGDFGTDENIHECVREFAARNLKADGRVLPSALKTHLLPVQYGDEFRGIWRPDYHGLDLSAGSQLATSAEPVLRVLREPVMELADAAVLEEVIFGHDMPERRFDYDARFEVNSAGSLQGFLGYFRAELAPGIELCSHPPWPACHWNTWHWPLYPPQAVSVGQRLEVRVEARPNMICEGWRLQWHRA